MRKSLCFLLTAAVAVLAVSCKDKFKTDNADSRHELPVNTLILNGVTKSVVKAIIDMGDLSANHYDIVLYFDNAGQEWLRLQIDGNNHLGKAIDLTKLRDSGEEGWYWYLRFKNDQLDVYAKGSGKACSSGTLYIKRLADEGGCPALKIVLSDCQIDGHNFYLNFNCSLTPTEHID